MVNISPYTSQQNPTTIISSTMDIPSLPSSSSSSSSFSSTFMAGSRTLDRHNPIITDEKRSGFSSNPNTPIGTPRTNHVLQQKPKTPTTFFSPNYTRPNSPITTSHKNKNKKTHNKSFLKINKNSTKITIPEPGFTIDHNYNNNNNNLNNNNNYDDENKMRKKEMEDSINRHDNVEYVSPPESSRYLLDDTSFLDVFSGFDPVMKLDPKSGSDSNSNSNHVDEVSGFDNDSSKPTKLVSSSSGSSDQVVMLRVLLHCRGCERKIKKLLSRLSGVTSFNIDFAAKEITVIGDVTPVQVLAIISKVKTVKLLSPTMPSSSHINTTNMEPKQ